MSTRLLSPAAMAVELGRRLERVRLSRNLPRAQLAERSGVSVKTVARLERGQNVSFETVIRIMQALGLDEHLAQLVPELDVMPIDRVRLKGKERQRARRSQATPAQPWRWEDGDKS